MMCSVVCIYGALASGNVFRLLNVMSFWRVEIYSPPTFTFFLDSSIACLFVFLTLLFFPTLFFSLGNQYGRIIHTISETRNKALTDVPMYRERKRKSNNTIQKRITNNRNENIRTKHKLSQSKRTRIRKKEQNKEQQEQEEHRALCRWGIARQSVGHT